MNEEIEILLVEDNAMDAEMTIRSLRKGNVMSSLHWVKDGQEALDFLLCESKYENRTAAALPKLMLLDINMPKVNGLEVLQKVKADEKLKYIPVVIMTSSEEQPDISKAYDLGVNSYIVKPIEFPDFAEKVAQVGFYWTMANRGPGA